MNRRTVLSGLGAAVWVVVVGGCVSPLEEGAEERLRQQLLASNRAYLQAAAAGPVIELSRPPSDVEIELTDERRAQLDAMSGPSAYEGRVLDLGIDLMGNEEPDTVGMTLRRAIHLSAKNNLDVKVARIEPAINQTRITQAESVFDAVYFADLNFSKLDTPQPATAGASLSVFGSVQSDDRSLETGIRKLFSSGGELTVSTRVTRNSRNPSFFNVSTYYDSDVTLNLTQPLLRNFGADVTRAQVRLTRNARKESVYDLQVQLQDSVLATEEAYWDLVFARQQLLIQLRLLDRTIADRDQLKHRQAYDVSPVRLTEANSFVELRRSDMIRARQLVRTASDRLKRLIYSRELPLAGEALIEPLDQPADIPIKFSLLDAVSTALRHRPQLQRSLVEINDASIRQRVADNQRLPQLDLAATVRYNGLSPKGSSISETYEGVSDGDFIDYILRAQFEVPIGNRGPEAAFQESQLARRQTVVRYQRNAEQVVLQVKEALRNLQTSYQLIGAARAARRAASDNLRAIEEQENAGVALTPEFLLDLKLSTQQRLANTEVQEIQAMTDYNTSIAGFHRAMGTLLERNGIQFADTEFEP